MSAEAAKKVSERNYGIDLLRLLSMFYIVVLHVLGRGGVLQNAKGNQYAVSWLMEIIAYCAVNCYGMISGYVCFSEQKKKYNYAKYISMWLQVAFYSVGFYLIMYYLKMDNVGSTEVLWAFFPVSTGYYWYFTAYTGVFFLIPWLNDAIRIISRKELSVLTGILLGIFSIYATLVSPWNDPFHLETGYSFLWLLVLYVVGAWMKKCKIPVRVNGWMAAGIIAVGSLISWIFFLNAGEYQMMLVSYISPTIVASAASYMILFAKIKTGDTARKIISFAAPAAFGVSGSIPEYWWSYL